MSTSNAQSEITASIHLFGDVFAANFPDWIARHACKLGLHSLSTSQQKDCLRVIATGQEDLLDAFALGCSLGPATVLVERMDYEAVSAA